MEMDSHEDRYRAVAVRRCRYRFDPQLIADVLLESDSLIARLKRNKVPEGCTDIDAGKRQLASQVGQFHAMARIFQETLIEGGWGHKPALLNRQVQSDRLEEAHESIRWSRERLKTFLSGMEFRVNRVKEELNTPAGMRHYLREAGFTVTASESGDHMLISNGFNLVDFWPKRRRFQLRFHKDRASPIGKRTKRGSLFDVLSYMDELSGW